MMKRKVAADDSIDGAEVDASRKRLNATTPRLLPDEPDQVEAFHPRLFGHEDLEELTKSYANAGP